MRKGFTLLELIVVIIIIGVLATLGITQYTNVIERSRGAEAKTVLGQIRTNAAAIWMERGTLASVTAAQLGIGTSADQIPSACRATNYFSYALTSSTATGFVSTATRCTAGGKAPNGSTALTSILTTDLAAGTDAFTGTGGY